MANLNLGQDVAKKEKENRQLAKSYLFIARSCKTESLWFSYYHRPLCVQHAMDVCLSFMRTWQSKGALL